MRVTRAESIIWELLRAERVEFFFLEKERGQIIHFQHFQGQNIYFQKVPAPRPSESDGRLLKLKRFQNRSQRSY